MLCVVKLGNVLKMCGSVPFLSVSVYWVRGRRMLIVGRGQKWRSFLPPTCLYSSPGTWSYEAPKMYGMRELLTTDLTGNIVEILGFSLAIELHKTPRC